MVNIVNANICRGGQVCDCGAPVPGCQRAVYKFVSGCKRELRNIFVKCVLRTSIGMMMLAVSPLKNNDVAASLSSWERLFLKNRVGTAKFWLFLLITLLGVLVHITSAQGTPSELTGTTLNFETGDLSGWTKSGGSFIGIDSMFVNAL